MKSPHLPHPHLPQPSLKHPGRWLWFILLVPVVLGLIRLRFDVEVFDLLPTDLKVVQGLKLYQSHFANARELLITVHAANAEQGESAARAIAERLRQQTQMVSSVTWQPPWQEHPEQLAELVAYLWFNQPPSAFEELTNRLAPDKLKEVLSTTREELTTSLSPEEIARLSYDPYGLTRLPENVTGAAPSFSQGQDTFSSKDGTFRILFVRASRELRTYNQCHEFLQSIRANVAAALEAAHLGSVKVGYTGRPAFVAEVARGMQHDIIISVGGTAVIIAGLFWLAHRRVKPMLWLLTLLALILGCTLALGGLIFGTINVVSMGFAAILLGLAVDYAVVHYQEALVHPYLTVPQIRHAIAPSIFWAAVTTITAFLVLNFGGLPGLGQLGTLVGLGVALAATIMIFEFLPPLFPGRNEPKPLTPEQAQAVISPTHPSPVHRLGAAGVYGLTVLVIVFSLVVLVWLHPPRIDPTADALRPRNSPAYDALDEIQAHLTQQANPVWLIVGGHTVGDVAQRLDQVQATLARAQSNQWISGFTLPTALWPRPDFQAANRPAALKLVSERPLLRQAAQEQGFAESALGLLDLVLKTWQTAATGPLPYWPTNPMSQWIFEKMSARTPTNDFAMGLVTPATNRASAHAGLVQLEAALPQEQVWLSGWELLGSAIFERVKANMWKVLAPMVVLVMLSLYLAFRRPPEILLSLAVLLLSGLILLSVMRLAHWSWNLLDLMAIPLVLGTGVDYSIFMQLALRRYHGDLDLAYHSVGRALLLCGGTAVAGFGSLAWSSNAGMASLGQVCAVGIGSNMLIAIFLLPIWWARVVGRPNRTVAQAPHMPNG